MYRYLFIGMLILLIAAAPYILFEETKINLIYVVDTSGVVDVRITAKAPSNTIVIPFLDPLIEESLLAYTEQGDMVPVTFNGTHIIAQNPVPNTTVIVEATLNVSKFIEIDEVEIAIKPRVKAVLYLPIKASIVSIEPSHGWSLGFAEGRLYLELEPGEYIVHIALPIEIPVINKTATYITSTPSPHGSSSKYMMLLLGIGIATALTIATLCLLKHRRRPSYGVPLEGIELDERDRAILLEVARGAVSISELARRLGISKSTVWRRVRKLASRGLISLRYEGMRVFIELSDKGREILERMKRG